MLKIFKAINDAMNEIGAISKGRVNQQQGYKFRGIDDMYNAIYPAFCKAGLFSVPTVLEVNREERPSKSGGVLVYTTVKVNYRLYADDGSFIESICIGEGMDSGDKSANKAMAAAQKYFFMQTFCIPTEEIKDSEEDSPEVAPKKVEKPATTEPSVELNNFTNGLNACKSLEELANYWISNAKTFNTFSSTEKKALTDIKNQMKMYFSK